MSVAKIILLAKIVSPFLVTFPELIITKYLSLGFKQNLSPHSNFSEYPE
jgi:hypothetical protein